MSGWLRRYRRLLGLVIVSLVLHVLVIGTAWRQPHPVDLPDPDRARLAVRLQAAPTPPAPMPPPQAPPAPARRAPDRAPRPAAIPLPVPVQPAPAVTAAVPVRTPVVAMPLQLPGRYRVRMPPAATLDYALVRADGTQAPARIAWTTNGRSYALAADGVTGPLASTGGIGDNGLEPGESHMRLANGGEVTATFAPEAIVVGGRSYLNGQGSQDPASLLLQLVGMGLAAPDQLSDIVSIYVATAEGPEVMQFEVTGEEALATPLGVLDTRHLRQLGSAGQACLEVWLAPAQQWLPVQLRLTAADGTVTTQTVTRIGDAGKPD